VKDQLKIQSVSLRGDVMSKVASEIQGMQERIDQQISREFTSLSDSGKERTAQATKEYVDTQISDIHSLLKEMRVDQIAHAADEYVNKHSSKMDGRFNGEEFLEMFFGMRAQMVEVRRKLSYMEGEMISHATQEYLDDQLSDLYARLSEIKGTRPVRATQWVQPMMPNPFCSFTDGCGVKPAGGEYLKRYSRISVDEFTAVESDVADLVQPSKEELNAFQSNNNDNSHEYFRGDLGDIIFSEQDSMEEREAI